MPTDTTALTDSRGSSWEQRKAAAGRLGAALPDAAAFARLVELLDDEDTGVGEQAAFELLRHGGRPGLAAVARAYATLQDNTIGYYLAGALQDLWFDEGYPAPAELGALASDGDPDVARGAVELAEYLDVT